MCRRWWKGGFLPAECLVNEDVKLDRGGPKLPAAHGAKAVVLGSCGVLIDGRALVILEVVQLRNGYEDDPTGSD